MKEYGILYAQVVFPKGHRLAWLRHCALTNILPKDLQKEIRDLSTSINDKYKESIIIPMDNRIVPGCTTTPEMIDVIATDIYNGMNNIFIGNYPLTIKVGRYLDAADEVGMFKV